MKNMFQNPVRLVLALVTGAALTLSACKKDPEQIAALISESEAAEIIEASLSARTAGMTAPAIDMAELLESLLDDCGVPGDTAIQRADNLGPATYTYALDLDWLVNCNALNVPIDATFDASGTCAFTSNHWNGAEQSSGNLTFTGLALQEPAYIANGIYQLTGDLTGNLRKVDPVLTCIVDLTLNDLSIAKEDYSISGGTGTFTLTASSASGQTKTSTGTLVFNGNGTATVTVGGYSHMFEL